MSRKASVRRAQRPVMEDDLLTTVRAVADLYGWLCYHTHNSKHSEKGFPDVVLVHVATGRILFRELKSDARGAAVTKDQRKWLDALAAVGMDAGEWWPEDLRSGRVQRELGPISHAREQ